MGLEVRTTNFHAVGLQAFELYAKGTSIPTRRT